jgi:hypothetical protein
MVTNDTDVSRSVLNYRNTRDPLRKMLIFVYVAFICD